MGALSVAAREGVSRAPSATRVRSRHMTTVSMDSNVCRDAVAPKCALLQSNASKLAPRTQIVKMNHAARLAIARVVLGSACRVSRSTLICARRPQSAVVVAAPMGGAPVMKSRSHRSSV